MVENDMITRFRGERRITEMLKFGLDQIGEIYTLQSKQLEKLGDSLCDIEEFLFSKHGIEIDLAHLAKHGEFLDENQLMIYRDRMFCHCKSLKNEL